MGSTWREPGGEAQRFLCNAGIHTAWQDWDLTTDNRRVYRCRGCGSLRIEGLAGLPDTLPTTSPIELWPTAR